MKRCLPLVAAVLLSACSLMPHYERPAAPVAPTYPVNDATADGSGAPAVASDLPAADTAWRDFFPEPPLQNLIETALANNRDLRLAALRIDEARATYRIARADLLPHLDATLSGTRARTPAFATGTGAAVVGERFDAGLALPAFELDYLRRVRSLSAAALASYLATDEARQAAQIGLVAEVANAWFTERAYAAQLALAQRTYEARRRTFDLTRQRLDAGASSLLDVRSNETLMETARASALALARQRAQAANALTLLAGAPAPQQAGDAAGDTLPDDARLDAMSALPAGLPSALLARRPDIRAAEQRLRAANANIGAARAAFFPRIALTAAFGSASPAFSQLFDSGGDTWSFTPQLVLPLFDAGRNRANLDLAEVRRNSAVADYERTIQVAFREVADALAARTYLGDQVTAQRAIQEAQAERLRLLTLRFESGVASSLDVLDAQRELFSAEQQLVEARRLRATNAVDLYRALGGGLK
ncbi:multidrug efflux system outer membrane protein [Pseudoduganella lurida]|uniref:Multidrug efflux system outer membrane protein n=1 Tax=Pseudoduganella lurida TaxID=1036180 RepID=A0A562QZ60_9BURK|nr:efflux transporter outer membrane subunit [Pseudoduganella lurida]TWI62092.1 multidrug efflux system outer membrane protein [Pseudoduganella lurida]